MASSITRSAGTTALTSPSSYARAAVIGSPVSASSSAVASGAAWAGDQAASRGEQTALGLGDPEDRVLGRHPHVARQDQLEPARQCGPFTPRSRAPDLSPREPGEPPVPPPIEPRRRRRTPSGPCRRRMPCHRGRVMIRTRVPRRYRVRRVPQTLLATSPLTALRARPIERQDLHRAASLAQNHRGGFCSGVSHRLLLSPGRLPSDRRRR